RGVHRDFHGLVEGGGQSLHSLVDRLGHWVGLRLLGGPVGDEGAGHGVRDLHLSAGGLIHPRFLQGDPHSGCLVLCWGVVSVFVRLHPRPLSFDKPSSPIFPTRVATSMPANRRATAAAASCSVVKGTTRGGSGALATFPPQPQHFCTASVTVCGLTGKAHRAYS